MKSKLLKAGLCALVACGCLTGCAEESAANTVDLNSMTFEEIAQKASEDGEVNSVGMPDTWANWGETWTEIEETYGIKHTDTDMSSAEELALFANEANDATKDIGDVGQSFGPVAEEQGVTLPYKTSYWESIPDWAKDDDGDWIIGYYGTITFITNTDLVDTAPTSWQDVLDGDYTVTIGGKSLTDVMSDNADRTKNETKETLLEQTKAAGWEIFSRKGNTCYGIAASTTAIVKSILFNENRILPVSVLVEGLYGIDQVYLSVPTILNSSGAKETVEIRLLPEEKEELIQSAKVLSSFYEELK